MTLHLSADIGGTKTLLQLSAYDNQQITLIKKNRYESNRFESFNAMLSDFLATDTNIDVACFAIAGPINKTNNNTVANVTNLPWQINQQQLQQSFNIRQCQLINDFQAIGYAINALKSEDLLTVQPGEEQIHGIRAVIGAGTGLGQAIIVYNGTDYQILSTEGGHADFAPNTEQEINLLRFLRNKWSHVSYERILSGAGIVCLFEFLLDQKNLKKSDYASIFDQDDPAAIIAGKAKSNELSLAKETIELFSRIYGAQVGNLALNCLPFGGLYIAGGIAAKNQEIIKSELFLEAFLAKGRMQALIKNIPVKLITNTEPGLTGATQFALSMDKQA